MTILTKPTPSTNFVRGWIPGEHRGVDWGHEYTEYSMQILAAADGVVIDTYGGDGYNGGWGRRIRIDHGNGNVTTYNHIRPGGVLVGVGQRVTAGQLIGRMGSSGAADGTHLHFELYLEGERVDPMPYFSRDLPGTGGGSAGGGGVPAGGQTFTVGSDIQYYYWHYDNALNGNYSRSQYLNPNQTLEVVENPGTGPVRVRCKDGDLVWVGTRNNPAEVNGGAPSSSEVFDVGNDIQYFYWKYENALAGNYSDSQYLNANQTVPVVENPGTGPVKVQTKDGSLVWVGTRNHPAATRRA